MISFDSQPHYYGSIHREHQIKHHVFWNGPFYKNYDWAAATLILIQYQTVYMYQLYSVIPNITLQSRFTQYMDILVEI